MSWQLEIGEMVRVPYPWSEQGSTVGTVTGWVWARGYCRVRVAVPGWGVWLYEYQDVVRMFA